MTSAPPFPVVPKKPVPTADNADASARLPMGAMAGDAMNASGMPIDLANSIKGKLNANKKSLPGVGFKAPVPSSTAKKAASSIKKAHKKMKGKK